MNKKAYVFVSLLTTISHFYCYAIFGLAAKFLASEFFPKEVVESGLTHFFGVLTFAVLVRPIASIIFGTVGDFYGRSIAIKLAATFSITAMIIISFLPNFEKIGYAAVVMLLISRILVLASITGESDGMRIYITEQFGPQQLNFANSLVSCTGQIGVLIASLVVLVLDSYEISLRGVFITGAILNTIVIIFRKFLTESKEFMANKDDLPISSFIKQRWRLLLVVILINGCIGGVYNFYVIFMASYAPNIIELKNHYIIITISIACYALCCPIAGYWADRFGFFWQALVALALALLTCLLSIVQLAWFGKASYLFIIAQTILLPFYAIPMQIYLKNNVPVNLRYRVFSLCHSLGSIVISTPTPFFASLIWSKTGYNWLNFCYAMTLILILICCLAYIRKKTYSLIS